MALTLRLPLLRRTHRPGSPTGLGVGFLGLAVSAAVLPWRTGVVQGNSMHPTLTAGSLFVWERHDPADARWRRGDVVVLHVNSEYWVKRVYATGGESVWLLEGINSAHGQFRDLVRSDQLGRFQRLIHSLERRGMRRWRLRRIDIPPHQIFVVGDGAGSRDSRELGPIKETAVIGKVLPMPGRSLGGVQPWTERSFPRRPSARSI